MSRKLFAISLLVFAAILVASGIYFFADRDDETSGKNEAAQDEVIPLSPEADTAGWKFYKNSKYQYEFRYPDPGTIFELTSSPTDSRGLIYFRINGNENDTVEFYILANEKKLSPMEYAEAIIRKPCHIQKSKLSIGQLEGYQLRISNYFGSFDDAPEVNTRADSTCGGKPVEEVPKSRLIFIPLRDESKILRIAYLYDFGREGKRSGETEEIIKKVLATFKITD